MAFRIFLVIVALVAFANSYASGFIKYVEVDIEVVENESILLHHKGIVELESSVRTTSIPRDPVLGGHAARLDYQVVKIGLMESGQPVAVVRGSAFKKSQDDSWVVLSEFQTGVPLGEPATQSLRRESGSEVNLNIKITPVTEQSLKDRFGGSIPSAKACLSEMLDPLQASILKDAGAATRSNCCTVECGSGSNVTVMCCGVIWCCDTNVGPDCCCAP